MNRIPKFLFLSAATALVNSAHAQYSSGDLILGFTTGTGNDVVVDLGKFSSLTDGETFNLNSILTSSPGSYANLDNLSWGVIGAINGGLSSSLKTVYSTVPTGGPMPVNVNGSGAFSSIATPINTIGSLITSGNAASDPASDSISWNTETVVGGSGTYFNAYGSATPNDPNSTTPAGFTSGSVVEDLYGVSANNTSGSLLGTFSLNSSGTLTFNASTVPEPSTFALAGLGLLAFLFRRSTRLCRKS